MKMLKSSEKKTAVAQADKPIVWALDPMDKERKRLKLAAQLIAMWKGNSQAGVLPVSSLTPTDLGWPPEMFPFMEKSATEGVRRNLASLIKIAQIRDVSDSDIVIRNGKSTQAGAQSVVDCAMENDADVIVTSTHGRRGFQRLRLGSFAESLMISSKKIPVLVVNANSEVPKTVSTIFFPTDYSAGSKKALKSVIKFAAKFKSRVIVYHFMETPNLMAAYDFYGAGPEPQFIAMGLRQAEEDCQNSGKKIVKLLKRHGIESEFILDKRSSELGPAILRNAQSKASDLIVMTASRGPFNQALFGRTMRDVLSGAKKPIAVVHG